jgi:hypothetical protein
MRKLRTASSGGVELRVRRSLSGASAVSGIQSQMLTVDDEGVFFDLVANLLLHSLRQDAGGNNAEGSDLYEG